MCENCEHVERKPTIGESASLRRALDEAPMGGCEAEDRPFMAAMPEPAPVGDGVVVLDLVMKDLQDRAVAGEQKYGTKLRCNNGRNALYDAYQEALDLVMYLRQAIEEAG